MEILNWNKLIAILLLLILYGCGQQTMKDEGLETKSINEAASSTPTFSIESLNISPSNPSATADNIRLTLIFNEGVTDFITPWRTSSSANTTACTNQAIQFYKDTQPNSCAQWKLNDPVYSNGYKTLELTVLSSTFSSSGEYTLKIPSNTLDSLDFTKKAEEYTKSVTLAPWNNIVLSLNKILSLIFLLIINSSISFGQFTSGSIFPRFGKSILERNGEKIVLSKNKIKLLKDDVIRTSNNGKIEIILFGGDKIYITQNSEIRYSEIVEPKGLAKILNRSIQLKGRLLSKIQKNPTRKFTVRTVNAIIAVKGTEYIVEYLKETTRVGTIKGIVSMSSIQNKESIDIDSGKMSSVDNDGTVLPIKAFSGEMMRDFEFAGERMNSNEASGEKIDLN